jgi:THO complex subunit 2
LLRGQVWLSGSGGRPKSVEVVWAEAEIRHATKKLLKRISSDKKKLKQDARSVARLAHSSPVVVLEAILNNAVAYDNQIAPLVECCAFMTPFALDCASFMMVRHCIRMRGTTSVK